MGDISEFKVLHYIRNKKDCTIEQIIAEFNCEENDIRPIIKKLLNNGKIHKQIMYYSPEIYTR